MDTIKKNVCILDDDESIRWILEKVLKKNNFSVSLYKNVKSFLDDIDNIQPDLIISDIRMTGLSGFDMLEKVKREYPEIPVIIMTAFSDLETTVSSFQKGAYEYITKPFDINEIVLLAEKACKNINKNETISSSYKKDDVKKIIGLSSSMQAIYKSIGKIAKTNVEVLILGETGTGKELIARSIHESSNRKDKPFVAINTGAIPTELLESELFGHEKGSFTGAYSQRIGRFEQASDGTLFLDEIGDMPLDVQTRLLRVLQEGEIYRVGGSKAIKVKPRIITATNKNLKLLVTRELFREDLLHRINAIKIELPNLENRKSDIIPLVEYFLKKYSNEYKIFIKNLSDDVKNIFLEYHWPGNIRELENICKFLCIMTADSEITINDLPVDLINNKNNSLNNNTWEKTLEDWIIKKYNNKSTNIAKKINAAYETVLINSSLKISNGNKSKAAKILGWGRNTIANKIKLLD